MPASVGDTLHDHGAHEPSQLEAEIAAILNRYTIARPVAEVWARVIADDLTGSRRGFEAMRAAVEAARVHMPDAESWITRANDDAVAARIAIGDGGM